MIQTLSEFVAYFRALATSHRAINDFVFGGSNRILNRENEQLDYPVLWLAYPDMTTRPGGEDLEADFTFQLFLLDHAQFDDWTRIDSNMNSTLMIMQDLLRRMIHDADEERKFRFSAEDAVLQPKMSYSGDNDHGWVLDFNLLTHFNDCYTPDVWT